MARKSTPARNAKQRENQLINLAIDLAEKQLRDGSATSQVITHFLKLATVKEQLENEKLQSDLKLAEAKIKQIENSSMNEETYKRAIEAMKAYKGAEEYEDY